LPQVEPRGCRTRRTLPRAPIAAGDLNSRSCAALTNALALFATLLRNGDGAATSSPRQSDTNPERVKLAVVLSAGCKDQLGTATS